MPNRAFLVIDMQRISFTPQTPRFDAQGVLQRINVLSRHVREKGDPVIFIQHDGTEEDECIPGTPAWRLLAELEVKPTDLLVRKTANDSFYRSELQSTLKGLGVDKLLVTGCATDFCVEATVQSALVKDYQITVIQDGHTTADRPYVSAENIINHYNWVWENMTPTQGCIDVKNTQHILST